MSIDETIRGMAEGAKSAAKVMSVLGADKKNEAVELIAQRLLDQASTIKEEN